jgi:hypothetical protein
MVDGLWKLKAPLAVDSRRIFEVRIAPEVHEVCPQALSISLRLGRIVALQCGRVGEERLAKEIIALSEDSPRHITWGCAKRKLESGGGLNRGHTHSLSAPRNTGRCS